MHKSNVDPLLATLVGSSYTQMQQDVDGDSLVCLWLQIAVNVK